ncbi:Ubiquitin-conjugating enzyme E2 [Dillenia turbinata]|uniref:Ubiquitin-conjugating enzyme E2 n=1 Tax=Dillenia turbinata TaxID=194707 RepID=A0AAN8UN86_9MAGN
MAHEIQEESIKTHFKKFDVVTDFSDHFYSTNKGKSGKERECEINPSSNVAKKIMQEWKILENNLPEEIFVRVYEERLDLMRAVIIGAPGTPYHDGLYFFDIKFPTNYPKDPPKVYYYSHGLRINPNLYSTGYVCLSLLNTWNGKSNEKWNPSGSTILQVLVSIQALVLNERPFFNEPGMKPGWRTELPARSYNDDVFILSCRTMMYLMKNPPRNFEALVIGHFRERAHFILSACKAYRDGCVRVGYYEHYSASPFPTVEVSKHLKKHIDKIFADLVKSFAGIGAYLGTFSDVQSLGNSEQKTEASKSQVVNVEVDNGAAKKEGEPKKRNFIGVFGKLRKLLKCT